MKLTALNFKKDTNWNHLEFESFAKLKLNNDSH